MATSCMPQGRSAKGAEPRRDVDLDIKPEWLDCAANYLLRIDLPGFKKEEFRVLVDAAGRLTVSGQRPAGHVRVHKAFQLPPTADLDGIAARFDGTVLCLTVPKLPAPEAAGAAAGTVLRPKKMGGHVAESDKEGTKWDRGDVVAAAVAGFALGVIISHRLFSARN